MPRKRIELYNDDCYKVLPKIKDKSIDLILTDMPYNISACKFDKQEMDLEKIWKEFKRIIKDNSAIVLFGQQPFTSKLIMSNLKMYKYNWVWVKDNATNFLNKRYQPGKITEDIIVFGNGATSYSKGIKMKYFPQITSGKAYETTNDVKRRTNAVIRSTIHNVKTKNDGTRLPNNLIKFTRDRLKVHETQKPVALLEYLIKTYSKEKEVVLDATMGSGSTGVACINTNRKFIGIELDTKYYQIAKQRIENVLKSKGETL